MNGLVVKRKSKTKEELADIAIKVLEDYGRVIRFLLTGLLMKKERAGAPLD